MALGDHYKGIPKKRDVLYNRNKNLEVLEKGGGPIIDLAKVESQFVRNTSEAIYYVRPSGDDNNDGLSESTAFATLERAFEALKVNVMGLRQIIDITGMKGANAITKTDGPLIFPLIFSGPDDNLTTSGPNASGPNNWLSQANMQLRAEMDLLQSITVNNVSSDPNSNLVTLTVDETLTPDAFVGKHILGSGFFEDGVVKTNTANTIKLSTDKTTWTAPVGIYEYGAEVSSGEDGNTFKGPTEIFAAGCNWFVSGVKFSSTNDFLNRGVVIGGSRWNVQLQQCDLTGIGVDGHGSYRSCYVHEQGGNNAFVSIQNNHTNGPQFTSNYFDNCGFGWESPWIIILNAIFEAPRDPVSRQHGTASTLDLENFEIDNAPGIGLRSRYRAQTNLLNGRIDNSGSHAIELIGGGGPHRVASVAGSGNAGYGLRVKQGAQCSIPGTSPTVTGTSGDISCGARGDVPSWSDVPLDDGPLAAIALVDVDGTTLNSDGIVSVTKNATGNYDIVLVDDSLIDTNSVAQVTVQTASRLARVISPSTPGNAFNVQATDLSGTSADARFHFTVQRIVISEQCSIN